MNRKMLCIPVLVFIVLSCKLVQSEDDNSIPLASFSITPNTGNIETIFTFDASGCSDDEDSIDELKVRWDWEDDGDYDTDWSTNKIATHQYDRIGNETIRLQVKDTDGTNVSTTKSLNISNSSPIASFTFTPSVGTTETVFTFDASGCTDIEDDSDSLLVRWDWDNDGNWDTGHTKFKTISHRFQSVNEYTVKLEVQDSGGLIDTLTKEIDISIADGALITQDLVLAEDLICSNYEGPALDILTSDVTLDLGGHSIINASTNPEKYGIVLQANNVTIKNGNIDGFLFGIEVTSSINVMIENVKIMNMEIVHPDTFTFGISVRGSHDVYINNCQFEFPNEHHKTGIISYSSFINVDNVKTIGGGCGVNFSFAPDCGPSSPDRYNGGVVENSQFIDAYTCGILLECSNNATIRNNEFTRNEIGISANGSYQESVTNLLIEENYIHDGFQGIEFMGITKSTVNNNVIQNGWRGIWMNQCHECLVGDTSGGCFYSINNIISNNTVTGNVLDLVHHELSLGNTWINNTCQTKEGDEIPDCTD